MNNVNEITNNVLRKVKLDIKVILEDYYPEENRLVGGYYSTNNKNITLYVETIKQQCKYLFGSLDNFVSLYKVVLSHELGHAQDKELENVAKSLSSLEENEKSKLIREAEIRAWNFAEKIISDADMKIFNKVKKVSLELHSA